MTVITPTPGRVVWYHPNGFRPAPHFTDHGGPCAATVAYVWGDRMVNLVVTDHDGKQHAITSVPFKQPLDGLTSGWHYAEWMPYQIGQAKAPA